MRLRVVLPRSPESARLNPHVVLTASMPQGKVRDVPTAAVTTPAGRTGWVLDLRPRPGLDMVDTTGPDGLRLTNATAAGSVHGYRIEAQRRARDTHHGVCIRLTAPDGRTLDVVGWSGSSVTNARGPASHTLSRAVAFAFKDAPTAVESRTAADRIEAVITTGHACLRESMSGGHAYVRVQCAAEGLAFKTFQTWATAFPHQFLMSAVQARAITWLIEAGFTPETTSMWFGATPVINAKSVITAFAAFRDHGWPPEHAEQVWRANTNAGAWAPVGFERYLLAKRAGLTPTAAKRLIRRDEWNEPALETLAALRN